MNITLTNEQLYTIIDEYYFDEFDWVMNSSGETIEILEYKVTIPSTITDGVPCYNVMIRIKYMGEYKTSNGGNNWMETTSTYALNRNKPISWFRNIKLEKILND